MTALLAFAAEPSTLRGKLVQPDGKPPAIETGGGQTVALDGDKDTMGVLKDKRLAGADLELKGHREADHFVVDAIHTKAMHVHRDGKRLAITYWCDTCAIRTFTPGICWCCQEETNLDLREEK
jgi:hypothetical protein